jgi:hypothetical protein
MYHVLTVFQTLNALSASPRAHTHWRATPLRPVAPAPRSGRYVMEAVCKMEPSFYGLQVPMGAVDSAAAAAAAVAAAGSNGVGGESASRSGSSFLPMVRMCRNVARWVYDSDVIPLAAGAGAGADSQGGGGGSEDGETNEGGSVLGGAEQAEPRLESWPVTTATKT